MASPLLLKYVTAALLFDSKNANGSGIPVPALISIIVEYAKLMPWVRASSVDTAAGNRQRRSVDGVGQEASFSAPFAVALSSSADQLFIFESSADSASHSIRCMSTEDVWVSTFLTGTNNNSTTPRVYQPTFTTPVLNDPVLIPRGMVADPLHPRNYYVSAGHAIWYFDETKGSSGSGGGVLTLFAGSDGGRKSGDADGLCRPLSFLTPLTQRAEFNTPTGMVITSDGHTMYLCDSGNNALRSISNLNGAGDNKMATQMVVTTDRSSPAFGVLSPTPRCLDFDRSQFTTPNTVLYVTVKGGFRRWSVTGNGSGVEIINPAIAPPIEPYGIVCLPSGVILFACGATHSIKSFDHIGGYAEILVGGGIDSPMEGYVNGDGLRTRFHMPMGLVMDHRTRVCWIADRDNNVIRCYAPPAHLWQVREQRVRREAEKTEKMKQNAAAAAIRR